MADAALLHDRGSTLRRSRSLRKALRSKMLVLGASLTLLISVAALLAPLLATHDPLKTNIRERLSPPDSAHIMGTDQNGRDVYSRIVFGARVSLAVGLGVVVLTTVFGALLGLVSGYVRRLDGPLMRIMDGIMAFPGILLALAIIAALGNNPFNVVLALTATYTPRTARVVRGAVLSLREITYVEAARSLGSSDGRIMFRHILPNTLSPILVQATYILARAVLAEAALSYIGAGISPPQPSWGNILADGQLYMYVAPWITVFPGLFIVVTVIGLNLFGDGLRDVFDPRAVQ